MPFPLAHPAAVLPLRRFCPQRLDFAALVIGSLVPDSAYALDAVLNRELHRAGFAHQAGPLHLADLSHEFIPGALGFDLPVGCLIWLLFYAVRRPMVTLLPQRYRLAFLPLCRWPAGFPWSVAASVLIGAWTHLFLDSITHGDGWMVLHLPVLHHVVSWPGHGIWRINDLLYSVCTFCGVAWLALAYMYWLETALGPSNRGIRAIKWACALLSALATLRIAAACRGGDPALGLPLAGSLTGLLVLAFALIAAAGLAKPAAPGASPTAIQTLMACNYS